MGERNVRFLILGLVLSHLSIGLGYRVNDFKVDNNPPPSLIDQIHLATDGRGKFAISWLDASSYPPGMVYLRVYRIDGTPMTPPVIIPDVVDNGKVIDNARDELTILPNGNIVIAKTVYIDSMETDSQIYGFNRGYIGIFDSLGNQLAPYFRGDTLPPFGDTRLINYSGIASDSQGNFTVLIYLANASQVYFQRFDANGNKAGELTRTDECGIPEVCGFIQGTRISMNPDGTFVISWDNLLPAVRIYNPDGAPVDDVLMPSCDDTLPKYCIATEPTCIYGNTGVHVDMENSGNFAVAFNGCDGSPGRGSHPYVRMFDSLRAPLTPNIKIDDLDTSWSLDSAPKVSVTNDTEYVVVWTDRGFDPFAPDADVYLKRYKHNGEQVGIKYRVNNPYSVASSHEHTRIAVCDSHLIIVWRDNRHWPLLSVYAQIMPLDDIGFFNPGDVNYDKLITLSDVIAMVNYIFKGKHYGPEGSPLVCDVNGDCRVTLSDVIYLVNYIFKPGWQPPVGCPIQ